MGQPSTTDAADDAASAEPVEAAEPAPAVATPRPWLTRLSWLVPALAVLALIAAAVLGGLLYREHTRQAARNAALNAARQVLINGYSIDYHSVTKDYQRFVDGTSGDLHGQLIAGKSKFLQTVQSTHTHETAQIVDAGLVRFDGDSATVAIALNSPITSVSVTKPQTRSYRTEVDVAMVHGDWMATAIRQVD